LESALPVAVDSGDETETVAFASAPLPSTRRLPELSEAFATLTAASAADGASSSAPSISRDTSDATLCPLDTALPGAVMPPSDEVVWKKNVYLP
jgi:hypothetical protein